MLNIWMTSSVSKFSASPLLHESYRSSNSVRTPKPSFTGIDMNKAHTSKETIDSSDSKKIEGAQQRPDVHLIVSSFYNLILWFYRLVSSAFQFECFDCVCKSSLLHFSWYIACFGDSFHPNKNCNFTYTQQLWLRRFVCSVMKYMNWLRADIIYRTAVYPPFLHLQNVSLVFNDFLAQLHVLEAFPTTMIYKYNSDTMKDLQKNDFQITPVVKQRTCINQLGINKQAMTRRGKRAGRKIQRPIQTVIGNRPNHHVPCHPRPPPPPHQYWKVSSIVNPLKKQHFLIMQMSVNVKYPIFSWQMLGPLWTNVMNLR